VNECGLSSNYRHWHSIYNFFGFAQIRQFNIQQQSENNRAIETKRQGIIQDYFNYMSDLMLKYNLEGSKPGDPVRNLARAQTLTAMRGLEDDYERKALILQLLHENRLIIRIIRLYLCPLPG
jgi:hypothetical protein